MGRLVTKVQLLSVPESVRKSRVKVTTLTLKFALLSYNMDTGYPACAQRTVSIIDNPIEMSQTTMANTFTCRQE